jgi:hypothetical protein
MDYERTVLLYGKPVLIDPRQWDIEMSVTPYPMFGRGSVQERLQYLTQILAKQEQLLQEMGLDNPFVTPDQYSYCLKKIIETAGYHNTASFFNDVEQMDPQAKMAALQKLSQSMATKAQAAQPGKTGPDPAIEQAKIASQEKQAQMKLQLEMAKEQAQFQLETMKLKAQMQMQLLQMHMDHQQAVDQAVVDGHSDRLNALLDAHVAHHGNIMANATKIKIAGMNGQGNGADAN